MLIDVALMFALGASLAYAFADVTARFGLHRADPVVGAMMALTASVVLFTLAIAASGAEFPAFGVHYLWMAAGGVFNPGLFFVLFFIGISRIGVSRAAPIKGSSAIFAALLAMVFLGEDPAWYNLAGILLVVGGIAVISSGRGAGALAPGGHALAPRGGGRGRYRRPVLAHRHPGVPGHCGRHGGGDLCRPGGGRGLYPVGAEGPDPGRMCR